MPAVHGTTASSGSFLNIAPSIVGTARHFVSFCLLCISLDLCNKNQLVLSPFVSIWGYWIPTKRGKQTLEISQANKTGTEALRCCLPLLHAHVLCPFDHVVW